MVFSHDSQASGRYCLDSNYIHAGVKSQVWVELEVRKKSGYERCTVTGGKWQVDEMWLVYISPKKNKQTKTVLEALFKPSFGSGKK